MTAADRSTGPAGAGPAAGARRLAWLPVAALALGLLFSLTPLRDGLSTALGDASRRWTARPAHYDGVVVVDVDDAALRQLEPRLGNWPYRRDTWALVIDYLREAGARLIVFDIVFSGARDGDDALVRAIARRADTVLATSARSLAAGIDGEPPDAAFDRLTWPLAPTMPTTAWPALNLPHARLLDALQPRGALGVISVPLDDDGTLRRLPLLHSVQGRVLPSLPLAALWRVRLDPAAAADPVAWAARWPQDAQGRVLPLLPANADAVPALAFHTLVADALGQTDGQAARAAVAGRTVFIGSSAFQGDAAMTVLGQRPGIVLLAQAHGALARGDVLQTLGALPQALLLALALVPALLTWRRGRPSIPGDLGSAAAVALALAAIGASALIALRRQADLVPALAVLGFGLLLSVMLGQRWMALANRRLAEERAAAQAASQAKGVLVSALSHELRTPMNAMLGFAQLLETDVRSPLAPHQLARVQEIRRGGQHLLDLVNDLLDQAAVEAGKLRIDLQSVPVAEVVDECLLLLRPLADQRGITLVHKPSSGDDLHLRADRRRLKQVLLNLLSNAIKYNQPEGRVQVVISADGAQVRVDISDTGPGISAADQQRLFQRFDRLEADGHAAIEGSGLGLALCKQLVGLMQGQSGVLSQPGVGSIFWIRLPRAEVADAAIVPAIGAPLASAIASAIVPAQAHVLYIDDDPVNVLLMEALLAAHWPARFTAAASGRSGLATALGERPDVILLDIHMPDMDGFEVLRQLRAAPSTCATPVIGVSGAAFDDDIEAGLRAGFDAYLTKPLAVEPLLAALNAVLGSGRAPRG